jgi:hypothetical protein
LSRIVCAVFLLISINSFAEVGGEFRGKMYHEIGNDEKVLNEKYFSLLGLTLVDSSLQDALKQIGKTPIEEDGIEPPRDSAQACYEGSKSILLLISPDTERKKEPRQRILNFIVSSKKDIKEKYARCTASPKIENLDFLGGLSLGMSQAEIKKIWGPPGKVTSTVMIYEIRRIQKGYFTDDISLYLEFNAGRLSYVEISRLAIP